MCARNDSNCIGGKITAEQWFWVATDSLLFVSILVGNLFTILVLLRRNTSKLISNHFVLTLAVTDTLVGLTLPYHMACTIFPYLSTNKTTCILRFVFVLLACSCSILVVTAIAFDRYFAVVHPFKYEQLMTKRVVRKVLSVGLVNAIVVSTVPIYWNDWPQASVCELGQVLPKLYMLAVLLPTFLIIWSVMIALYARIWREALVQAEKLRRASSQCRPSFQVVLLVMGCFTVCWLPFLAVSTIQAIGFRSLVSSSLYKAALCLALSSSAFNPLIYAWKNAEFKEAVQVLVKCGQPV